MIRTAVTAAVLLLVLVTCTPSPGPTVVGAGAPGTAAAITAPAVPGAPVPELPDVRSLPLPVDPPDLAQVPAPPEPIPPVPPVTAPPPETEPPPPPPPPAPAPGRSVTETGWSPFATVGPVVLAHPSSRVERVGFHESTHDGARQLDPVATTVLPITMETRGRGTGSRSAADVVVDPGVEIRAPVTGTVRRAGSYVLYCDHRDDYAVIEPDARPGWEVKVLHITGVAVRPGMHVHAGETVLAGGPTVLPFDSQVDEHTAEPSWPHVHVEVVDPSIPDRPSPGGGC